MTSVCPYHLTLVCVCNDPCMNSYKLNLGSSNGVYQHRNVTTVFDHYEKTNQTSNKVITQNNMAMASIYENHTIMSPNILLTPTPRNHVSVTDYTSKNINQILTSNVQLAPLSAVPENNITLVDHTHKKNYPDPTSNGRPQNNITVIIDTKKCRGQTANQPDPASKNNIAMINRVDKKNSTLTTARQLKLSSAIQKPKIFPKRRMRHLNVSRSINNLQACEIAIPSQFSNRTSVKNASKSPTTLDLDTILKPIYFDSTQKQWTIMDEKE